MPAEKKRSAHIGFRLLRMAGMVYLGLFAWGWLNANRLAFFPPPPSYDREVAGLFFLEVEDGERIAVRHLPLENATATVIFAHGNAEDLGDLEGYLLQMQAELRVEV